MNVLQVEGLQVRYGAHVAVKGLSFDIRPGEVFGLLGPNGAGKSSTMHAIEGLNRPSAGRIEILGVDPAHEPLRARACLGVQLQATQFQPDLTIRELLTLYAGLYGVRISRDEIGRRLRSVELEGAAHRRPGQLSGGQRQRLALLVAMVHEPPLLLLDEPTSGLDPQSRRALWSHVETQRAGGRSVLLTTHSMEEAAALADRIAIMVKGEVAAQGTPEALVRRFRDDPRARAVARGQVTLEDVFLALAGREGEKH